MKKQSKEQMLFDLLCKTRGSNGQVKVSASRSEVTWDYADGYNQAVEDIAKAIDIKMKEVSNV
jgi:hypothetical protein